ncbi:translation initiation factor eIF2A [Schizosaccharomyces japonicus yFS275]|uniref:Eukaryotic translation initiation factor 2A n=1 Tax=Schizosaccharomyces japonicus (strain yFS275 / FY16936) TaxID=402676 RepID=B6K522_SCHJY|nr:translation initiation factor eIF2A [Schizosaccharomyces japonicus yFS275]EEB08626.1 translation initiation factor eIF2A [Schizosaccharomyces japonicus yFS275]
MPQNQFAYRSSKTLGIVNVDDNYSPVAGFAAPTDPVRTSCYSKNGKFFAFATAKTAVIVNPTTGSVVSSLAVENVYEMGFSPLGSYISTWERPSKDQDGNQKKNMKIWSTATGELLFEFVQRNQTGWNVQYTYDESIVARLVTNEVHFYEAGKMAKGPLYKLRVEGLTDFALSPGQNHAVAVFVPERKGAPAIVRTYNIPSFNTPVSQKTFFKADKVQFKWNTLGTSLLVLAQTEVDRSNKNYYGETNLYLLGIAGQYDCRVDLDREGPIHDVSWSSNSKEFGVVYGYMPAKTAIFDNRANIVTTLPSAPRNTLLFSPNARYVMLAGFGNLQGSIDIYDSYDNMRKLATVEAANTTHCEFSPESEFLLTSVTSPRLRVDNSIKIWHITGKPMFYQEFNELYQVTWRPKPSAAPVTFGRTGTLTIPAPPQPHESAAKLASKPVIKATGAYRPPGARGQVSSVSQRMRELDVLGSSASSKPYSVKKERVVPGATPIVEKKNGKQKKQNNGTKAGANAPAEVSDEKKIRSLCKKLRAIDELKARLANGEKLEVTQIKKIETEPKVLADLKALGWSPDA